MSDAANNYVYILTFVDVGWLLTSSNEPTKKKMGKVSLCEQATTVHWQGWERVCEQKSPAI